MSVDELTSLTSKERILLYLSDFRHLEDRYEVPPDVVQERISYCTGVQRKHLSKYLKDLIDEQLVSERKAHVTGMKQRMTVYHLTPAGFGEASQLCERIGNIDIEVADNGKMMKMKVSGLDEITPSRITYCDIVREAIEKGRLSLADLLTLDDRKRRALETKECATDTYKRALETAWRDGRVTSTERFLIEELRKHLNVSETIHRALEEDILRKLAQDHMEFLRIYRSVLEVALADGELSGPEVEIMDRLRRDFMISRKEHDELLADVRSMILGPGSMRDAGSVS